MTGNIRNDGTCALIPEKVFDPTDVFEELKLRRMFIRETIEEID